MGASGFDQRFRLCDRMEADATFCRPRRACKSRKCFRSATFWTWGLNARKAPTASRKNPATGCEIPVTQQ
jgi:hypothetical protein